MQVASRSRRRSTDCGEFERYVFNTFLSKTVSRLTVRFVVQNPEQADEAVEHMCFLTDAHHLYNNALGLYDLELTILVAQQAQKVCNTLLCEKLC